MIISDYLILIADDHPLYRAALGSIVADSFDDVAVVECQDVESAVAMVLARNIDLVLLDLSMPDADGLDGASYATGGKSQHTGDDLLRNGRFAAGSRVVQAGRLRLPPQILWG
jgi:DNA-binding LytR/AlgR family response regulator